MVNYATIQRHIDRGLGHAARKLGPPYLAYRVDANASGDFPTGWSPVSAGLPLFRRRNSGEGKLETGLRNTTVWYNIIADMTAFLLGDVFVQNDPPYVPGVSYGAGATSVPGTIEFNGICLVQHKPVAEPVGARLDRRVRIFRPSTTPAANPEGSLSWKATLVNDQPLVLTAGAYAFGSPGAGGASWVPVGLSATHRKGDPQFSQTPAMVKPSMWFFYVPPLPGYTAREGDALVDENGARYVVSSPYEQMTGLTGWQMICERKVGPPG